MSTRMAAPKGEASRRRRCGGTRTLVRFPGDVPGHGPCGKECGGSSEPESELPCDPATPLWAHTQITGKRDPGERRAHACSQRRAHDGQEWKRRRLPAEGRMNWRRRRHTGAATRSWEGGHSVARERGDEPPEDHGERSRREGQTLCGPLPRGTQRSPQRQTGSRGGFQGGEGTGTCC